MSCMLRVSGESFDAVAFLRKSNLQPARVYEKGTPRYPDGPISEKSGINFAVSEADFDDLPSQILDAVKFLKMNRKEITRLRKTLGMKCELELDFGVEWRESVAIQCDCFPWELLKLCGQMKINLMISQYPPGEEKLED